MGKSKKNRDRNRRKADYYNEGARKDKEKNSRFDDARRDKETQRNIFVDWDSVR